MGHQRSFYLQCHRHDRLNYGELPRLSHCQCSYFDRLRRSRHLSDHQWMAATV